jgi:hypothetical protein
VASAAGAARASLEFAHVCIDDASRIAFVQVLLSSTEQHR